MSEPTMTGIHHVAINVHDVDRSVQWYCDVLGFTPLFPYDTDAFTRRLLRHPSGIVLGLSTHNHPDSREPFSERRPGLDHLSFGVASEEELAAWVDRLDAAGVTHSDITVTPATGSALVAFRDPDNIQLELYVAQGATATS